MSTLQTTNGALSQMSSATQQSVPNSDWYTDWAFGITISATATVQVEWSRDESTWHPAADAITASDSVFIKGAFPFLRVRVTSYGSGTVDVDYVGHLPRSK